MLSPSLHREYFLQSLQNFPLRQRGMHTDKCIRNHMQLLLYLVTNPYETKSKTSTSLAILRKILSVSPAIALGNTIPSITSRRETEIPPWLKYKTSGKIGRKVRRVMHGCRYDGIWGLLWVVKSDEEDGVVVKEEAEEEEVVVEKREISKTGWQLLGWLVDLWEKDEDGYRSSNPAERECRCPRLDLQRWVGIELIYVCRYVETYSPLLLHQLPQPYNTSTTTPLPQDNASVPISIIQSAFDMSGIDRQKRSRQRLAIRLLRLVSSLSAMPSLDPSRSKSDSTTTERCYQ